MVKKEILLLDMDEVLVKTVSKVLEKYNKEYNANLKFEEIKNWDLRKYQAENTNILKYFFENNFFYELEPYEDALEYVEKLYERYDTYIVTIPSGVQSIIDKKRWLEKYFPFIDEKKQMYVYNKSLIKGDIIVDDNIDNVITSSAKVKILIKKPWNENIKRKDIIVLNDLKEVYEYLEYDNLKEVCI